MIQTALAKIAIEAAQMAADCIVKGIASRYRIETKTNPQDLVTEFDKRSEAIIIETISKRYPDHHFLGEETGHTGHGKRSVLWIIDPIDGTMNFAHQFPWFAINIAAIVDGQVEIAVTHNPLANELFVAGRNKGAFLNGKRIQVSKVAQLPQALLSTSFPYGTGRLRNRAIKQFGTFAELGYPIRMMGSAALSLAYVAAGKLEAHWGYSLKPWDIAAGKLLIEEAGGTLTLLNGDPVDIFEVSHVVATNKRLHTALLPHLL